MHSNLDIRIQRGKFFNKKLIFQSEGLNPNGGHWPGYRTNEDPYASIHLQPGQMSLDQRSAMDSMVSGGKIEQNRTELIYYF